MSVKRANQQTRLERVTRTVCSLTTVTNLPLLTAGGIPKLGIRTRSANRVYTTRGHREESYSLRFEPGLLTRSKKFRGKSSSMTQESS